MPVFEKISNNPYLMAIRDGFISLLPVILFSSLFLLVAFVPNIFGHYWPDKTTDVLLKAYNYSMGILGLLMSATIAKSLSDNFNRRLPKLNQINSLSVMVASIIGFLLLSVDSIEGGFGTDFIGTKGLLSSFVAGFIVPNIYKICVKNNITIKMPKEVPSHISQTFADLIPMALSILVFWVIDILFRYTTNTGFSEWVLGVFQPLFTAADSYLGLAIIYGAMAFFWFVGIHGPSIVEPAVSAIYLANVEANFMAFQAGEHATKVLSQGSQYFVATIGGTGATLIITIMFAFMAKSKQLKAVGRASLIPVAFGINEPVLFGGPLVLNPMFLIPFIAAPIVNVWLLKLFIDLGMNGFVYNLPWTTPGPIGLIMGTGFAPMSFLLAPLLLLADFLIYYPFMKAYDTQLVEKEKTNDMEEEVNKEKINKEATEVIDEMDEITNNDLNKSISVLVICANGATSGMLANAIGKGANEKNMDVKAIAMAYGQHTDVVNDFDLVVLAPQMGSRLEEVKKSVSNSKTKVVSTSGKKYVALTREPIDALNYVLWNLKND
nr:PTS transporter subunit EIIC [Anaerosalibacter massiliensis]